MFNTYLKIAWRGLKKNQGYTLINIGGLAIGIGVAMLIGLWIYDEVSFNTYHKNHRRIAQVMTRGHNSSGPWVQERTGPPMGEALISTFANDFKHVVMASQPFSATLSVDERSLAKRGAYFEPGVVEMLSLKLLTGSFDALRPKQSILLSASLAKELFGGGEAMGKTARLENKTEVIVTGVFEDIPANSEFSNITWIAPWSLYTSINDWIRIDDWRQNGFFTYVQLADHADLQVTSDKIKGLMLSKVDEEQAKSNPELFLHPMDKWRLHSGFEGNTGRIRLVWLFGSIGFFVLVIACINFMNLSTARSEKRAKEVGIRKAVGSLRAQLIQQFYCESLLVALLSFVIGIALARIALPLFAQLADKPLQMPWMSEWFWLMGLGFTLLTGLLAGSYPALYLSSFQPVKVLKGSTAPGRAATVPRKILVVLQFTVAVTLIIGVVVIFRQIQLGKDQPLGYNQQGLLWVNAYSNETLKSLDLIRDELKQANVITEIAQSVNTVANIGFRFGGYEWPGMVPGTEAAFATAWVSPEFGKTVGWNIIAGRDFSREIASDTTAVILNEASVNFMNLEDPIGKIIKLTLFDKTTSFTVIGVIKDMLQESPYQPVQKTMYMLDPTSSGSVINIKINPEQNINIALGKIESVFKKYDPYSPFVYSFVKEAFARKFEEEERIGRLAFTFATLAIFISCLGMFGLASFTAEQRTKEIGIRKVLGASIGSVWRLLCQDFIVLVVISIILATPLSWYLMKNWLEQFELRTTLSWYIFCAAGLIAVFITLLTVSQQAIRAAMIDPAKSLKNE